MMSTNADGRFVHKDGTPYTDPRFLLEERSSGDCRRRSGRRQKADQLLRNVTSLDHGAQHDAVTETSTAAKVPSERGWIRPGALSIGRPEVVANFVNPSSSDGRV